MPGWWTAHPALWRRELDALTAAGWAWRIEDAATDNGVIAVHVDYPVPAAYTSVVRPDSTTAQPAADTPVVVPLFVRYPPTYPWFPPDVADLHGRLDLPRHRQPVTGTLCLLAGRDWRIGTTAADLLRDQLPRLLAAATAAGPLPAVMEIPAPEPVGNTLIWHAGPRVLVDGALTIGPQDRSGALLVGFNREPDGRPGAGAVKLIQAGGENLEPLPARLTGQFPLTVPGRWTRWDGYQPGLSPAALWRLAERGLEPVRFADPAGAALHLEPDLEVLGLLVPSETRYRTPGEEWLFVLHHRTDPPTAGTDGTDEDPTPRRRDRRRFELYRSAAAGPTDVTARTPATAALRETRVLLVGVGAIGGTVATGLARAGVGRLDLVDGDTVDPATACRQTAPVCYAGYSKASALQALLADNNPHVHVVAQVVTIGAVQVAGEGQPDPHAAIAHLVRHADLVVDTAADPAVSRYLAGLCVASGRAFLHASATAGAHGGIVALFPTGAAGCWWCMLHHRHHHTLPYPPAANPEAGTVVPVGCTEPTFTGTGADLDTIASHATRTAIGHLTGDQPTRGSVLYVATLRDPHGRPVPVSWRTRRIRRHADCRMHPGPASDTETVPRQQSRPNRAATAQQNPTPDRPPRRRSEVPDRDGQHLENSTEETNTTRTGATGRGGARPEAGPKRR